MFTRHRTIAAACPMSGIPSFRAPRAGWRRDDPADTGDGGNHGNTNDPGTGTGTGAGDGKADGQGDGDGSKTPKIDGEFDADRAARALAAARDGEKKAKAEKKAADERVAAILQAAGLTPDGKTDPAEQLKAAAAERDKAVTKARETAVELSVYKSAGKAGADPDAVLDSRGFLTSVADLDPDTADFADKVTAAIKAAVKANPKLAATATGQGPGKQGADHTGAGGGTKSKPKNLTEAITAKLSGGS